jgi:hypothetical protein
MHYSALGRRFRESGTRFLIDDRFKDRDAFRDKDHALVVLKDEPTGDLELCRVDGILNLDGQVILLLGSADPEDLEGPIHSFYIVRLIDETTVELAEEELVKRIQEIAEEAIAFDRKQNLARVESVLGRLRVFDHSSEVMPY